MITLTKGHTTVITFKNIAIDRPKAFERAYDAQVGSLWPTATDANGGALYAVFLMCCADTESGTAQFMMDPVGDLETVKAAAKDIKAKIKAGWQPWDTK